MILPNEFLLVAACCRWPPSEVRNAAIRSAASQSIDWDKFLRVVDRQRVAGLAHKGLKETGIELPLAVKSRLAARAGEIARQCLKLASEALTLQAVFDSAAIPAMFLKGTALGLLAYNNIGIKQAWDIDLLVLPEDVGRVCKILAAAGYKRIMPPESFTDGRFFSWTDFAHECIFLKETTGAYLELHWRLSANPAALSHITATSTSQLVVVSPGHALRTIADEGLFAFLCMHGALHGWSRLKWLADLAAWLSQRPAGTIDLLYRKAKMDGVGRAAAQALLLCEQLFAMPLPPDFALELRSDRATRWLVAIALDAMAGDAASRQTDDRPLGNLKIEISHFLLATSAREWFRELYSKSIGWTDFQQIALPRSLFFLYPVLRVPSWIWRRAVRIGQLRQPAA